MLTFFLILSALHANLIKWSLPISNSFMVGPELPSYIYIYETFTLFATIDGKYDLNIIDEMLIT